ncbi:GNAT family N-acetyltransferase [Streptococcus merionis]|uniref:GNAT family N-acetyltransferase n=1 Tax=Streptococcus merionis TaxID=400065 RepID=UPI003519BF19
MLFTNRLNTEQLTAVKQLIKIVQQSDGTARTPYLSNMLNFDHELPTFFLSYEGEQLVGFLTVYADEPDDVELAILVHPEFRRQGIATGLLNAFYRETAAFSLAAPNFWTERAFLDKHPDFPAQWNLVADEETDIWLTREREPYLTKTRADVQMCQAEEALLHAIAQFQSQTFDNDYQLSLRYAKEALQDEDSWLYVLLKENQVIASCTVDLSSDYNYLYGLAVLENYRGQGYGTYLVQQLVNDLLSKNDKPFQIAVEEDNIGAKRLYEKIGFVQQTQIIYLKPAKEE